MAPPKNAKVWNTELVNAFRYRADLARRQGKTNALTYTKAANIIENVRGDIYQFSNGRIVAFPTKLSITMADLCRKIITGDEPVVPAGHIPLDASTAVEGNPYDNDPYLKRIKKRGGAFAVLLALHQSQSSVMTKEDICRCGQVWCDDEMMENFHAGRMHGAWAGHKTLVSHNLLLQKKSTVGYNERAGGFRSSGAWSYSLTDNGKLFIEALLARHPDIKEQLATSTATQHQDQYHRSESVHQQGVVPSFHRNTVVSPMMSKRKEPSKLNKKDLAELEEWLQTARVGCVKEFNLSKERRKFLHNACDDINNEHRMTSSGRQLRHHSSDGDTRARSLHITLIRSMTTSTIMQQQQTYLNRNGIDPISPDQKISNMLLHNENGADSDYEDNNNNSVVFRTKSPGRKLSSASTTPVAVTPRHAAATAAYERYALSQCNSKSPSARIKLTSSSPGRQLDAKDVSPAKKAKKMDIVDLLSSSDDDDDDDPGTDSFLHRRHESKVALKKNFFVPAAKKAMAFDLSDSDSDDDDDILNYSSGLTTTKTKTIANKKTVLLAKAKVADGDDATKTSSAGFKPKVINPYLKKKCKQPTAKVELRNIIDTAAATTTSTNLLSVQLNIFIDDRERNRNSTPRMLRTELTRLCTTGPISMIWPKIMPFANVEEKRLESGDFAYTTGKDDLVTNRKQQPIPVLIERKRVGDLVQRSYKKDHWFQLQRMQDAGGVAVLLVEGDSRTANGFVAHGAQYDESNSMYSHTIDDQDSFFRFLGRAILNDRSNTTRFVQTKEEQGSLRAVTAFGLMSVASSSENKNKQKLRNQTKRQSTIERTRLSDFLVHRGIPYTLASRIADEVKSRSLMEELYASSNEDLRDQIAIPLIQDLLTSESVMSWSRAIHRCLLSKAKNLKNVLDMYQEHCNLVEEKNKPILLAELHNGNHLTEAVDTVLTITGSTSITTTTCPCRVVKILSPRQFIDHFPTCDNGRSIFCVSESLDDCNKLPVITMQTIVGEFCASKFVIYPIDGSDLLKRVKESTLPNKSWVDVAVDVACRLKRDMDDANTSASKHGNGVLVLRGMAPALEAAAKKPGSPTEYKFLVEMIQAELMLHNNTVVLHAPRLSGDLEILLNQLALACYHYQLILYENVNISPKHTFKK